LTSFIDESYQWVVMGKSKRSRKDSPGESSPTSPTGNDTADILLSIEGKLSSFDARLGLLEALYREIQALRESLEYSQQQVEALAAENSTFRESVKYLNEEVTRLSVENKKMKETVLDVQGRSMRDNLVLAGLPEQPEEDAEVTVKNFLQTQLKLPEVKAKAIQFDRVHRLGAKRSAGQRPRPIVVKFVLHKEKEEVKRCGRQLRGTDYSMNDQFPKEILERRKILFPIRRRFLEEGARAVISVDKLYVNGHLHRDQNTTPWLY
jgi:regulator of replication initiation timing